MRLVLAAALVMAVGTARADQVNGLITDPPGSNGLVLVPQGCAPVSPIDNMPGCGGIPGFPQDGFVHGPMPVNPTPAAPVIAHPRAYTLDEIDRMRAAMKELQYPPCPVAMGRCSPAFTADELESRLRTYMSAGISPEDLERKVEGK